MEKIIKNLVKVNYDSKFCFKLSLPEKPFTKTIIKYVTFLFLWKYTTSLWVIHSI